MERYEMNGEKRCIILDYLQSQADLEALQRTLELFNFTIDCPEFEKLTREGTRQLLDEGLKLFKYIFFTIARIFV